MPYPPTIVVVHPKERRSKCTLEPLRGRPDLEFVTFSPQTPARFDGYIRLAPAGPPLSPADRDRGLLLLDGTWRLVELMERHFSAVPARSLPALHTAYPRVSKLYRDPPGGLASVEALYAAYRILGRPTRGLLEAYHWADRFLQLNDWA